MTNAMLMRNTLTAAERQVRLGVKVGEPCLCGEPDPGGHG